MRHYDPGGSLVERMKTTHDTTPPHRSITYESHTWKQSVQGAVATWSTMESRTVRKHRMRITDQVAFKARRPDF